MPNPLSCLHCGAHFRRPAPTGRTPQYCSRSCRQRAFEARRRGGATADPPDRHLPAPRHLQPLPNRYESGAQRGTWHALRREGFPDSHGRLPTLCGAWALPMRPLFGEHRSEVTCRTCERLVSKFPPKARPHPSRDLAALRARVRRARDAAAHEPVLGRLIDQVLGADDS